jgi:hypothetical protein
MTTLTGGMKGIRQSLQNSLSVLTKVGRNEQESDTLQDLNTALRANEVFLDGCLRAVQKQFRSSAQYSDDMALLADSLTAYADFALGSNNDNAAGTMLKVISDLMLTMEYRRGELNRELDNNVFNGMRNFLKEDVNSAKEQKKKYNKVRQQFEDYKDEFDAAKLNRKLAVERRKEIEDLFETSQIAFRDCEYETTSVLMDCNKNGQFLVIDSMIDAFDSYYAYYCGCMNFLEQKRGQISLIRTKVKEEREKYERERVSRATRAPAQHKILLQQNSIFGTSLRTSLERERNVNRSGSGIGVGGRSENEVLVPRPVLQLINWVDQYGLKVFLLFSQIFTLFI